MLLTLLILNTLWFCMGFHTFYIRRHVFAKTIVPKENRDTPVFQTLIATGRFMGGFNLAFAILNILLLLQIDLFDKDMQWVILLLVNAAAHGSQFVANIPIALQNQKGGGVWQVFSGLMLFIFIIDFILMTCNAVLAATFYF